MSTGLYLHIPFCSAKCRYCNFYSRPLEEEAADRYVNALIRGMERQSFGRISVDTIYLGGGTPGILGAGRLSRILEGTARFFQIEEGAEITLEANPESINYNEISDLYKSGYNRISFGVQSSCPEELTALGRRHGPEEAKRAIIAAHNAGFRHISADLMLAIPRQTEESLRESVDFLARLPLDHISAYLLKLEEGTPLYSSADAALCPDEEGEADLYLLCCELLEKAGFAQYEISNFAKPGGQSGHNLKYWRCEPYLGIGPSAHSYMEGRRFFFPSDLDSFLAAENPFRLIVEDGAGGDFEEYAMLRLRLREGLDLAECGRLFPGEDITAVLERAELQIQRGLVRREGDSLSLTRDGFLLSNAVTAKLLFG